MIPTNAAGLLTLEDVRNRFHLHNGRRPGLDVVHGWTEGHAGERLATVTIDSAVYVEPAEFDRWYWAVRTHPMFTWIGPATASTPAPTWPRTHEAAKLLGVSTKTIQRRVKSGELKAFTVCGITRFDPAELARLAEPVERPLARTKTPPIPEAVQARLDKIFGKRDPLTGRRIPSTRQRKTEPSGDQEPAR